MTALKTVAEMRSAAKSLGLKNYSKMNKADLAAAIDAFYRDNNANVVRPGISNSKRHGNYVRQNGTDKMTPAQSRRIKKNAKRRNDPFMPF